MVTMFPVKGRLTFILMFSLAWVLVTSQPTGEVRGARMTWQEGIHSLQNFYEANKGTLQSGADSLQDLFQKSKGKLKLGMQQLEQFYEQNKDSIHEDMKMCLPAFLTNAALPGCLMRWSQHFSNDRSSLTNDKSMSIPSLPSPSPKRFERAAGNNKQFDQFYDYSNPNYVEIPLSIKYIPMVHMPLKIVVIPQAPHIHWKQELIITPEDENADVFMIFDECLTALKGGSQPNPACDLFAMESGQQMAN